MFRNYLALVVVRQRPKVREKLIEATVPIGV